MIHDQKVTDRLARKTDRKATEECWPFLGSISGGGYGRLHVNGRTENAHRIAWEISAGSHVPEGLVVRHRFDNRACCNPDHLEIGTHRENTRDAIDRGRFKFVTPLKPKSTCRNGHEYTPENSIHGEPRGKRCRTCKREKDRRRRAAKAATSSPMERPMRHEIITADEACSAGMRAQLLINGHIAQIDAALRTLKAAKDRLLPSIYAMHSDPLNRMRRQLARDLDSIMAAPLSADIVARRWNSNAHGPDVLNACEAVDRSISRAAEVRA